MLTCVLVAPGGGSYTKGAGDPGPAENAPSESETNANTDTQPTGTGEEGKGSGDIQLRNDADPSGKLRFEKSQLASKPGQVTIVMDNPSPVPHAIAVRGRGVKEEGETVEQGGTSQLTAKLAPGEYEFYCPVPGHEPGGMKGTLSVAK